MNRNKEMFVSYVQPSLRIIVTVVLCFYIFHWGYENKKICFAITLGVIAYLCLCFYNFIFKNDHRGMITKVLSGVMIIAFANELYNYEKIVVLFPILKNIDPLVFAVIMLGGILMLFIIVRLMMYIYGNADDTTKKNSGDESESNRIEHSSSVYSNCDNNSVKSKGKSSNAWMGLYFVFLIILTGFGCILFSILYNKGFPKHNYDFFEVVSLLLKYAGSVVMILLAVMVVIIFLIEMIRLIISRMKAFSRSIKADTKGDTIPLYALSAVLDLIVCYLAYKYTGITMDSFYNFVNEGKYLALPLMILFVGIAFVIFMRLTHATLVLLVAMKPEDVVSFLKRVNDKTKISEKVVEIIKMIIDIVLDSIITALSFVSFIRDYFNTIYSFVFGNECVFEYDEDVPDSYEELLDNTDTTSSKREV